VDYHEANGIALKGYRIVQVALVVWTCSGTLRGRGSLRLPTPLVLVRLSKILLKLKRRGTVVVFSRRLAPGLIQFFQANGGPGPCRCSEPLAAELCRLKAGADDVVSSTKESANAGAGSLVLDETSRQTSARKGITAW